VEVDDKYVPLALTIAHGLDLRPLHQRAGKAIDLQTNVVRPCAVHTGVAFDTQEAELLLERLALLVLA
jgi:hypothetical protein